MDFDDRSWLDSPKYRELSPVQRAVFIDLYFLMARQEPVGRLVKKDGRRYTLGWLVRKIGVDQARLENAVAVLIGEDLFQRDEQGILFCPDLLKKPRRQLPPAEAEKLQEIIHWWNGLNGEGLVSHSTSPSSPAQSIVKNWGKVPRTPELREAWGREGILSELEEQIRHSSLCREGWFRLEELIAGRNRAGEYKLRKLLDGGYRDETGNGQVIGMEDYLREGSAG